MTQGIPKNPPMCRICGKVRAIKYYCKRCAKIAKSGYELKRERKTPTGLLVIRGIKRAPRLKIIKDPGEFGYPPGASFEGKQLITDMLAIGGFNEGTIVKAGNGNILQIKNKKFVLMEGE